MFPAEHQWLLVWCVTPGAAVLCLARGMEYTVLQSAAGNAAAGAATLGLCAVFCQQLAARGWAAAPEHAAAPGSAWTIMSSEGALLNSRQAAPPLAALAATASGFLVHFTLPALTAAMTTPRRVMEAVGRGYGVAAVVLLAFGALGAAAAGSRVPRCALDVVGGHGTSAVLLRLVAAADAITTAPVLCRPGLLVVEGAWEKATLTRLSTPAAAVLRVVFVAAAAAAAAAPLGSVAEFVLPIITAAAAVCCALVFPALLLLAGREEATGAPLVHTSSLERGAAASIMVIGVGALVFGCMTSANAFLDVPYPYNAPPAPPSDAEYDYAGGLQPAYMFTRTNVSTLYTLAAAGDGSTGGGGGHPPNPPNPPQNLTQGASAHAAAATLQQRCVRACILTRAPPSLLTPCRASAWANPANWNHGGKAGAANGTAAVGGAAVVPGQQAPAAITALAPAAPAATVPAVGGAGGAAGGGAGGGGAGGGGSSDA